MKSVVEFMRSRKSQSDTQSDTQHGETAARDSIPDGAVDTLGCIIRTMGDESFPLADETSSEIFRAVCEEFARHIENGAPVPSLDIAQAADGSRQWARVRRFFIDRRKHEKEFVTERLGDYRGVVDHLVDGLRKIGQRDQDTEQAVRENLSLVTDAVDAGVLPDIKSTLRLTVQNITEEFSRQKKEYELQIRELKTRMSDLRQDLVAVREEMQRDPLTNTYNRGAFDAAIVQSMNVHFILKQPVTLVMVDLDNFKAINDNFGHAAGDEVLRSIGDCLTRSFIRKNDFPARYGGDEFAIILTDTTAEHSTALIKRFMENISKVDIPYARPDVNVTCSAGYTEFHDGDSVEAIINRADGALYEAKAAGRNQFKHAPPTNPQS